MTGYYCLAETTVNGEVIVQGNSATYSARTSGSATSDVSFEDAAKIATAASNATALVVGRAEVEKLLKQYAYVLSDLEITEMVTNNLRTQVLKKLKIILLETIAAKNGNVFTQNRNVTIKKDQILIVPSGSELIVPGTFVFNNMGELLIGTGNKVGDAPSAQVTISVTDQASDSNNNNTSTCTIAAGNSSNYNYLILKPAATYTAPVSYYNYSTINVDSYAYLSVEAGVLFPNTNSSGTTPGKVIIADATAYMTVATT